MFQRTLIQRKMQMGRNTVAISMAAPLQHLLITVKVVALEKISFTDRQYLKAVC